jgi:hypothetical protein
METREPTEGIPHAARPSMSSKLFLAGMQHIMAPHNTVPFNTATSLVREAIGDNGKEWKMKECISICISSFFKHCFFKVTVDKDRLFPLAMEKINLCDSQVSKSSQNASKPVDHDILGQKLAGRTCYFFPHALVKKNSRGKLHYTKRFA